VPFVIIVYLHHFTFAIIVYLHHFLSNRRVVNLTKFNRPSLRLLKLNCSTTFLCCKLWGSWAELLSKIHIYILISF